jgi:cobyrinic acid a,c-diamide synthase
LSLSMPRIVIAGTHSGTGKSSLALALIASLKRRGLRIQAFKVGPDFLDPSYLTVASESPCYNLGGWMASKEYVRSFSVGLQM